MLFSFTQTKPIDIFFDTWDLFSSDQSDLQTPPKTVPLGAREELEHRLSLLLNDCQANTKTEV